MLTFWQGASHHKELHHMPKPYEFGTEAELVQRLGDTNTVSAAKLFFAQQSPSITHVVETGVAGNTFRAFRNLPVQPSVTFRTWATNYVTRTIHELSAISDCQSYAQYVHDATNSLCEEWRRITGSEMGYGRGAKLFNLVLKKFACLSSLSEGQRSTLIDLQHIPLDSYTIIGLRAIAPEFFIPKNATMKFVETPAQYADFQAVIREIANKAGVPPIYYDVLAWNMGH
ncbi:hypothetical protein [Allochromatium warmingii]|nr:hypothetical protein [Allochromatium warmingii]